MEENTSNTRKSNMVDYTDDKTNTTCAQEDEPKLLLQSYYGYHRWGKQKSQEGTHRLEKLPGLQRYCTETAKGGPSEDITDEYVADERTRDDERKTQ